jgi:methanogenic corrinoid protein MtbC1
MGIRDRILLNAGGGAVSEQVAEKFGCDVFAETAVKTCTLIRETVAERHR